MDKPLSPKIDWNRVKTRGFHSPSRRKYIKNSIYHSYSKDTVFIEDYAFLINALNDLSDKTMNFKYKDIAKKLSLQAIDKFYLKEKNICKIL